ncbi:kelch-like protein 5 [Rhopalosiphum padi]|uniref:kelch-like protein 5 n=1 Tax=Rhopalosiphum padi TaxID=40932 RepID=UPI00298E8ECC|nr:kelch-like protein 5 [Rhopalosiphum padi]
MVSSLSSPCWVPLADMLVRRKNLGVGVLYDCIIYAVNRREWYFWWYLNTVEVFDNSIKIWRMVTSMNTDRSGFVVGVLNDHLYAVGGYDGSYSLKSVECYDPRNDTWIPVADMSVQCTSRHMVVT